MSMASLYPVGSTLGKSHKIEAVLGEGGFGFVTKCFNTETNKEEAVKVNKGDMENVKQARYEIAMLKCLRKLDPDTSNIVMWNGFFFHQNNVCLSFEILDQSLCHYIYERGPQGLPVSEIKPILQQLANALVHLKSVDIVHADLKPLNVMVVNRHENPVRVKVIDFGLAQLGSATTYDTVVQTLWYRAPEVLVCAPFNVAIDMWTLGLIAVELALGLPLYTGDDQYDVLRFIVETQGQPPDYIVECGETSPSYFHHQENEPRWRFKTPEEVDDEYGYYSEDTRYYHLKCLDDIEDMMVRQTGYHPDQSLLVQLIKEMLNLDPAKRIKPTDVLKHPFFAESSSIMSLALQEKSHENVPMAAAHSNNQQVDAINTPSGFKEPHVALPTPEDTKQPNCAPTTSDQQNVAVATPWGLKEPDVYLTTSDSSNQEDIAVPTMRNFKEPDVSPMSSNQHDTPRGFKEADILSTPEDIKEPNIAPVTSESSNQLGGIQEQDVVLVITEGAKDCGQHVFVDTLEDTKDLHISMDIVEDIEQHVSTDIQEDLKEQEDTLAAEGAKNGRWFRIVRRIKDTFCRLFCCFGTHPN